MLKFRPATYEDIDLLFRWINDRDVRKNSFSQDKTDYSEHQKWFSEKIESEDCKIFIFTSDSKPVGQVRFEIKQDNTSEISILIDRDFRGKRLSSDILRIASMFAGTNLGIRTIFAHIKLDNERSVRAFEKAGYRNKKIVSFKNQKCLELTFSDE